MFRKDFGLRFKVILVVFSVVLITVGCGSSDSGDKDVSIPLPGGNSISLDKEGGEVNIKGQDGEFQVAASAAGVEYPAVLAEEFPVCPGCTPVQSTNIGGHMGVMLTSKGSLDEAYAFYLEHAKSAGYTIGLENQGAGMKMFVAEKGEKSIHCSAGQNEDGSLLINIRYIPGE